MAETDDLLVVDDRRDNLALLRAILEPEGFAVRTAASGRAALQLAAERPPDLVLLDVMMPDLDGFAVCRALRERPQTRFTPVILVTALTATTDHIQGLEAGADEFVSKPFNEALLLAKIRALLKLKRTRDELDELKRDFANMVVHDLRAPVHSILGLTALVAEDAAAGTVPQTRLLELIVHSAEKIDRLINDFLDLGQLEGGRLKLDRRPSDLVGLARQAVEAFQPSGRRRGLRFVLDHPPGPVTAPVDPERLDQVLTNLLQNAVKFSPDGGEIRLAIEPRPGLVRIAVTDQGPGIPPADLEAVFHKYAQRDRREGGVGLGLFLSRAVVEAHGGKIWAEPSPAGGARLAFDLPLPGPPSPSGGDP